MNKLIVTTFLACSALMSLAAYAEEQTVEMNIEKMTCAMCPFTVRKAMQQVDGVRKVEVDYEKKTAVVTYDDTKTDAAEVAQASTDVGYPATLAAE